MTIQEALDSWLAAGCDRMGQVAIRGLELCHWEDLGRIDLKVHTDPFQAREIAKLDDAGNFRPLTTAPTLRHGWRLVLRDTRELRQALDCFYPAMLGSLLAFREGRLRGVDFRETAGRQSGMYAIVKRISDEDAEATICRTCNSAGGCLKTILWKLEDQRPVTSLPPGKFDPTADQLGQPGHSIPLLCSEACNLLVAEARAQIKRNS